MSYQPGIEDFMLGVSYTRKCCICGSTWKQTLWSEASKDICSQPCADEHERRLDAERRAHVCPDDGPCLWCDPDY